MSSLNRVYLIGTLGHNPVLKTARNGSSYCHLSVATRNISKDDEEFTEWHSVHVFGRQAEVASTYLSKGRMVFIEGSLGYRKDENPEEPTKSRWRSFVTASKVQFLGSRHTGRLDSEQVSSDKSLN